MLKGNQERLAVREAETPNCILTVYVLTDDGFVTVLESHLPGRILQEQKTHQIVYQISDGTMQRDRY